MKITVRHANVACVLAIAAIGAGCQKEPATVAPATTTQAVTLSPEESFKEVVESFRRGMEEIKIGFAVPDSSGGLSTMTGSNDVSSELIPPGKEGEPYRGIIKVVSQARYSVQRSGEEPLEAEQQETDQAIDNGLAATGDESATEVFDPALVSPGSTNSNPAAAKPGKGQPTIASREKDLERMYELVYENGRWKLTTKLDPKTEKSIQHAFDRALDSQS
jgi:hypothetical protein